MKTIEFLGYQYVVEGSVGAPDDAIFLDTLPSARLVEVCNLLVSHLDLGRRIKMFQNKAKGVKRVSDLLHKYDVEFNDDLSDEMQPATEAEAAPAPTAPSLEAEAEPAEPAPEAAKPKGKVRDGSKQAALIDLIKRPEGASIKEIAEALNWVNHTARGAISRDLKKRLGLAVTKSRVEGRGQVYRIES